MSLTRYSKTVKLSDHQPSAVAQARAEAAGLNLEHLKTSDPARYKMMNATRLISVAPPFVDAVTGVLVAAFKDYDMFKLEGDRHVSLLTFPPLASSDLKRFDDALGRLAALPAYQAHYVYYRVVNDPDGEHRELDLPIDPATWSGELGLVGPFMDEPDGEAWLEEKLPGRSDLAADLIPQNGRWFVDVFSSLLS